MPTPRKHGNDHERARRRRCGTSLTPAAAQASYNAARLGLPKSIIADLIGVDRSTFFDWLRRGRDEVDPLYNEFYTKFTQARGEGAYGYVSIVNQAAAGGVVVESKSVTNAKTGDVTVTEKKTPPNATAAQWVLERIWDRQFGSNKLEIRFLEAQVKALSDRLARLGALEVPEGEAGEMSDTTTPPASDAVRPELTQSDGNGEAVAEPAGTHPPAPQSDGSGDSGAGEPFIF